MIEETVNALTGPAWELWADLNYRVAANPQLHGAVEHLLAIAVKLDSKGTAFYVQERVDLLLELAEEKLGPPPVPYAFVVEGSMARHDWVRSRP